jgi:hypothetical protein
LVPNTAGWSEGVNLTNKLLPNQWYHVAAAYNGTQTTVYINGQAVGSYAGGAITAASETSDLYIGSATYYGGFTIRGNINDFRIYDHCCSAKEIAEIAKGLVIHYPLDNNGQGGTNLISTMQQGGRTTLINKYTLDLDLSQQKDTYFYFNFSPALELNKTYTISFDVENYPSTGGTWGWYLFKQGASAYYYTITGNGHYTWTFTTNPNTLPEGYSLTQAIADDGGRPTGTNIVRLTNFKCEEGNADTIWKPHTTAIDSYPEHKEDTSILYDCSGYGRNASVYGSILSDSSSPRYDCGKVFDNSTTYATIPMKDLLKNLLSSQCTFNFWCKEGSTSSRSVYFGGYDTSAGFNIEENGGAFRVYLNGTPDLSISSSVSAGVWTMWTVVIDKNTGIIVYKNGAHLRTHSGALTVPPVNINPYLGRDARDASKDVWHEGSMSDFKIYATALSAAEVQEMYQVSMSIDNHGRAFASTFKEE